MLLPGQTAFDRPDITVRIFHEKLKILLKNIRDGYYFGDSTVVYELRVIEYQHRGLPHAHVVFKLSNVPPKSDEDNCCEWIDRCADFSIRGIFVYGKVRRCFAEWTVSSDNQSYST